MERSPPVHGAIVVEAEINLDDCSARLAAAFALCVNLTPYACSKQKISRSLV